jgi:alpha 1,3-glucosidase
MWRDPITLVVALDKTGTRAQGEIYLDDGDSYNYETGEFIWRGFKLSGEPSKTLTLSSYDLVSQYTGGNEAFKKSVATYTPKNAFAEKISSVNVDDIVILGLSSRPSCIRQTGTGSGIAFEWQDGLASSSGSRKNGASASVLRIKSAGLPVTEDWQVEILFSKDVVCEPHRSVTKPAKLEDPTCLKPNQARCENAGHISACVLLSRVNDGICDPECCDGSDETDGKVHCPNRCAEVNKAYRAEKDEEARIRRVGSKIRKDWSKAGLKDRRAIEKNIEKLKSELVGLQEREQQLRDVLDKVEKSEASDIERKKASRVYQRIGEHQTAIQSLRKHRAYLQNQIGELSALLSDLKKSFNPNYQDMAVLGSVRAFDEWRRKNGYEITDGPAVGTDAGSAASELDEDLAVAKQEVQPVEVDFDDLSDEHLTNFEQEDIIALLSEFETSKQAQTANLRELKFF